MSLSQKMGDAHEKWLAKALGFRRTRGSGSQWRDKADVKGNRYYHAYPFVIDGKSTRAKSISVSRVMLNKLKEDAEGERPCLAVRFYDNDRLTNYEDWALITMNDFREMLDKLETP